MDELPPYRLPRNVVPNHYSLTLIPDLALAAFDGEATIEVEVGELDGSPSARIGDLIAYQKDRKCSTTIVGKVGIA